MKPISNNKALQFKGFFYEMKRRKIVFLKSLGLILFISVVINPVFAQAEEEDEFLICENPPSFPGGDVARIKFLHKNIQYPEYERDHGVQGLVIVSFTVEKDGGLSNIKILKGISPGLDKEAIRIVKLMPDWIPGTNKGEPVRVIVNLPIRFHLDDSDEGKKKKRIKSDSTSD